MISAVILPTVWLYLSHEFHSNTHMLGFVISAFSVAGLLAGPLMGRYVNIIMSLLLADILHVFFWFMERNYYVVLRCSSVYLSMLQQCIFHYLKVNLKRSIADGLTERKTLKWCWYLQICVKFLVICYILLEYQHGVSLEQGLYVVWYNY